MTDLLDEAKPVRDAAWLEIQRCIGSDDLGPTIVEGHKLGTHLQALCVAFCARRYKDFHPRAIAADDLLQVYAIAAAQVAAHMAGTCRPMVGGQPLSPTRAGQIFIQQLAYFFFQQLTHQEHGLLDFNIPFQRKDDGSIEVETFDFHALMKKREA